MNPVLLVVVLALIALTGWLVVLSRRQRSLAARIGLHICGYPTQLTGQPGRHARQD